MPADAAASMHASSTTGAASALPITSTSSNEAN